ncbi:MAG: hypothetical protein Q7R96_04325, partial [Nanoarchaeota archaeon]|nr:hypothetical protein [Nanoarchaeota archaeon]
VVHADEGNMKHRIHARKHLVPSEKVFLDHLDEYQELQAMSVARVKQESTMVLELPNNDKNDLEMLIRVVQKVIK